MRFAVLGAGATGGYLGACLVRAGLEVTLIARGPHLEAMRSRGLRVLEPDGTEFVTHPRCTDDLAAVGEADTVFVTVKAHSLPALAPQLKAALGPETCLVFAQNGIPWWFFRGSERLESVDPGGVIEASIELRRVLGCVVYAATSLAEPGVVRHQEGNRFTLAEPDGSRSERVLAISAALARAGLRAPVSDHFEKEVWVKLLGNATYNPVSALTRATLAEMAADPATAVLLQGLMEEVATVARNLGLELGGWLERRQQGAAAVGEHKTSMLQDLEAGRPLEVEALVGSVVELGRRQGLQLPRLEAIYACVRLLDRNLRRQPVPGRKGVRQAGSE